MLMHFTVVGYFEDNNQPWVDHVAASDVQAAMVAAVQKGVERGNDAGNMVVVEVFYGYRFGQTEHEKTVYGSDLLVAEAVED